MTRYVCTMISCRGLEELSLTTLPKCILSERH